MSVIKVLRDLDGLFNYSTDENPTSQQDYQKAVKNWVKTIVSLVDAVMWQPETEYVVGDTVKTPSLSKQALLLCITAGQSGAAEPDYTDVSSNDEITDGTVVWRVQTITSQESQEKAAGLAVPTGVVQAFAGNTLPNGWLLCDGSAVSRSAYAALYAVIGTTYGAGNGSTTFNLPNLTDRFIQGNSTVGTVKNAGLPNISGTAYDVIFGGRTEGTGALIDTNRGNIQYLQSGSNADTSWGTIVFDARDSNSIYGNSTTVQPPALTMKYIIKY